MSYHAGAFRIGAPPTLTLPLNDDQVNQLNEFNQSVWELSKGEFNFDIVAASKTDADNGDMWIITGAVVKIQIKVGGNVYSFSQD